MTHSPRTTYLVGSVPLENARAVFETVGAALGPRLRWLPDGETGARLDWITWLEPIFKSCPALEPSGEIFRVHAGASGHVRYRLKPGRTPADVGFGNLLYADNAIASYKTFAALKAAGKLPAHVKFQVDLVPAHSILWLYVVDELQTALDPIFNTALQAEIDRIQAAITAAELASQFDVASAVFARLQRAEASSYGATKDEMQAAFTDILVKLANHVPRDIDLMFHFCYGDAGHKHVVEPVDMADMVALANRLTERIARPVTLIHMPVPRDRSDDAYFAPLRQLRLGADTKLALGLVHHTDGLAGTLRRLATASRFAEDFAIGTECGFGRRDPATLAELLALHAAAADAVL